MSDKQKPPPAINHEFRDKAAMSVAQQFEHRAAALPERDRERFHVRQKKHERLLSSLLERHEKERESRIEEYKQGFLDARRGSNQLAHKPKFMRSSNLDDAKQARLDAEQQVDYEHRKEVGVLDARYVEAQDQFLKMAENAAAMRKDFHATRNDPEQDRGQGR